MLAKQTAVYMSDSSVAYNHERLTWRAELSVSTEYGLYTSKN